MPSAVLRLGAGIIGSVISLLLYGAPIVTFRRVIRKRTTEDFSGFPYAVALFNCLLYTYYASPLISNKWDNLVVLVVNAIGLALECCFISIYLIFAPLKPKRVMVRLLVIVLMVFGTIAISSVLAMHDRKHKKMLVGTAGMVATVILYGSPLSTIRLVIKTKSVEFMPLNLSVFSFLCSAFWLAYGALSRDIVVMAPNFVGLPLASAQMIIYWIYQRKKNQKPQTKAIDAGIIETAMEITAVEDISRKDQKIKADLDHDIEMQTK
eukprot:PITA_01101